MVYGETTVGTRSCRSGVADIKCRLLTKCLKNASRHVGSAYSARGRKFRNEGLFGRDFEGFGTSRFYPEETPRSLKKIAETVPCSGRFPSKGTAALLVRLKDTVSGSNPRSLPGLRRDRCGFPAKWNAYDGRP